MKGYVSGSIINNVDIIYTRILYKNWKENYVFNNIINTLIIVMCVCRCGQFEDKCV